MRKKTYHARDGTRKKSRIILGVIGALTAVLIGLLPQQVVEASWADEHHNTAVALYGGVNISGGWSDTCFYCIRRSESKDRIYNIIFILWINKFLLCNNRRKISIRYRSR